VAKEEEKPKKYKVRILSREEITTYPRLGEAKKTLVITYDSDIAGPGTVFLDAEKATDEEIRKAIREDIEKRLKAVGEELEV